MSNPDLTLLDALQMAMEAEQKAAAFYDNAAQKVDSPLGQELFEQLADFERYHYAKLDDLARSLREEGTFIDYEGKELSVSVPAEVEGKEVNKMSVLEIIALAIDTEQAAQDRYTALAEQTTDPAGQEMFKRLAQEEHTHYRILNDEYYHLNNDGLWVWME